MIEKRLAPSILSADFGHLADQIKLVDQSGADMIHVDIMDGHFVPNLTIGPVVVEWLRPVTSIPFDVHLMIENADEYIGPFAKAGANLISVHFEACTHLNRTIQHIKSFSCKAGVVLNPATPVELLEDTLQDVDYVLLMSVNPGFGGQKFIPHALEKAEKLKTMRSRKKLSFAIEMDGGIALENLQKTLEAGVDWFVSGSAIFQSENPSATVKQMKKILGEFSAA
jgi:ribulose-phosphate 3-epimerase